MKKFIICMLLIDCATPQLPPDPGIEPPQPMHNPSSGLCCQTYPATEYDSYWGPVRSMCSFDGGSNPNYSNVPWICNTQDGGTPINCQDPSCMTITSQCLGFNGPGAVVACDELY